TLSHTTMREKWPVEQRAYAYTYPIATGPQSAMNSSERQLAASPTWPGSSSGAASCAIAGNMAPASRQVAMARQSEERERPEWERGACLLMRVLACERKTPAGTWISAGRMRMERAAYIPVPDANPVVYVNKL